MNRNKFLVNFFLAFVKITGLLMAWIFFKPKIYVKTGGKRRLQKPAILVSNHRSLMDFALYLLVFPFRTIRFLMAEVLFNKGKGFADFLYALGGIYVNRDSKDFSFVSNSIEVLDNGGIIGIFPQGRLPVNEEIVPFTVSAAYIAIHSDAPIIPVFTDGNYGIFKRARVVIGEPVYLFEYLDKNIGEEENLKRLTNILQEKVYELEKEIYENK